MKKPAVESKALPTASVLLPEKLSGEPERFYRRFLAFCLACGMARSVEAIWRKEQEGGKSQKKQSAAPGSWYKAAESWRWRERAAEYDHAVLSAEAAELEVARKEERARRRSLASVLMARAEEMANNPALVRAAPASVTVAVLRALEASRREFGADVLPEDRKDALPAAGGTPGVHIIIEGGSDDEDELIPLEGPEASP